MGQVAPLRQEKPTLGLVEALDFARETVPGKAPVQLGPIHHLIRQSMLLAGAERSGEHRAVYRTAIDAAGDVEQPFTRESLQLPPQLVGAAQQGDVAGMLPVGQTDDSGETVGRAEFVEQVVAFQAQDAETAPGEMKERGAPHPAQAYYDDIVLGQKLTFRIFPSVPTSQPECSSANATAQKFSTPGSVVQPSSPSVRDQAAPPGPVITTSRPRSGT